MGPRKVAAKDSPREYQVYLMDLTIDNNAMPGFGDMVFSINETEYHNDSYDLYLEIDSESIGNGVDNFLIKSSDISLLKTLKSFALQHPEEFKSIFLRKSWTRLIWENKYAGVRIGSNASE